MSTLTQFERRSLLPVDAATAFRWHEQPGAFERLTPPWEHIEVVQPSRSLAPGSRVELILHVGPFPLRWVAEHTRYQQGVEFQDVQVSGPFARFEHTHRISPRDEQSCWLDDVIQYTPPGGRLGHWLANAYIRQQLDRMFRYRHAVTIADLAAHAQSGALARNGAQQHQQQSTQMKILISGASGLVGTTLTPLLTTGGHEVLRLTRTNPQEANDIPWEPVRGVMPAARLEGLDGVVHLAGENIAGARWTPAVKDRIRQSRIVGTRLLCETLAGLKHPPRVLVCASATGFYGDRGTEVLTEDSSSGTGFLPDVCRAWEEACAPAREAGIRVVNLRIGVVLSPKGGALQKMLLPFKLGGGGVIGSGKQYWSWIALDDLVGAIYHALTHDTVSGPVNATAPQPVTNYEFTKTLGRVLHRPTLIPLPAFAARLVLGEMANDLLLASTRVTPDRLLASGYQFRCPTLDSALRHELGL